MVDFSELFDGEIEEFTKKAKVSQTSKCKQPAPVSTDCLQSSHKYLNTSMVAVMLAFTKWDKTGGVCFVMLTNIY